STSHDVYRTTLDKVLAPLAMPAHSSPLPCGNNSRVSPAEFASQPNCPADTPARLDRPLRVTALDEGK
ncbi:hypothetical protein SK128_008459, partial [Halocaridina rubra]